MNVLFISNDPSIFDDASPARARMRAYAKEVGVLHIISQCAARHKFSDVITEDVGDGKLLVLHPIYILTNLGKRYRLFKRIVELAKEVIAKEQIQIVSAQDPFEYGLAALRAATGTSAKLHIQVHTDPFSLWFTRVKIIYSSEVKMPVINRVRQSIADQVLPQAHGIRVVSKRVHESLMSRYGSRIPVPTLIPIAVSSEVPKPMLLPDHPFTFALITVGRLEPEKRIQDTLQALARIRLRYPTVGLFVVGEGSQRKNLEHYARKLKLTKNVQFLGHIDNAWGMMQNAQAYIQSSGYEGYSRTLLEAALARTPIITTDVGIVGEVFRGYEDVLAAPPGDPTSLAAHIVGLVEDNQARHQFVMNAEKSARDHLVHTHTTPADIAADLRRLLETSS
jgi:glycosyltransferase involved in cell wall biosynthesis